MDRDTVHYIELLPNAEPHYTDANIGCLQLNQQR